MCVGRIGRGSVAVFFRTIVGEQDGIFVGRLVGIAVGFIVGELD